MSLKNLEKVNVLYGNDMYPSIDPKEKLLLDRNARPEIGDVVLFENRFGMKIPHRLIHEFAGYYFTRGDNCRWFNFPCRKKDVLGVIVGKKTPVIRSRMGELVLAAFLPYYILYCRLFDIKKKKWFILIRLASKFYPYLPPPEQKVK